MYDFAVVGAGFYGATFARVATELGKSCIVFERSSHVAGAAHDFRTPSGLLVSSFGAHIFHTDSDAVWQFVNRFGDWYPFINRPKVLSCGRMYSFPVNLMTLSQLWGCTTPAEAEAELRKRQVKVIVKNFEDAALAAFGREIYEKFFYSYTKKQYMREPCLLPASIFRRLPIRLTYNEDYFNSKYQAMPTDGYTRVVERMLDSTKVELGTPLPTEWKRYAKRLIHTGRIDQHFNYEFGKLEFLSMRFEHESFPLNNVQGNYVVNHCDESTAYLRSVEHRHAVPDRQKHHEGIESGTSTISYDYPSLEGPEYYPIRTDRNRGLYSEYSDLLSADTIFGGRIGSYSYYDMDQAIAAAMQKARQLCS